MGKPRFRGDPLSFWYRVRIYARVYRMGFWGGWGDWWVALAYEARSVLKTLYEALIYPLGQIAIVPIQRALYDSESQFLAFVLLWARDELLDDPRPEREDEN